MRTITLPNPPDRNEAVRDEPEVIHTGGWLLRDTAGEPVSVTIVRSAVDILHNQPELHQPEPRHLELPGSARARSRTRPTPLGRSGSWLTTRADVSSDDLAVIRHALTAVAEVKVRA
ncbi:hypothetical protein [Nonomuraea sp. NPDC002799]